MALASNRIKSAAQQFASHPQLWFTAGVALAIFASFLYISDRFVGIAQSAQERLVHVRVGALQDAFVPFAGDILHSDTELLKTHMQSIAASNPTITDFFIAERAQSGVWYKALSYDSDQVEDEKIFGYDLILTLALADPANSFTIEEVGSDGRFFRTARAIIALDAEQPPTVVITRQTLSEADRQITYSIRSSLVVLVLILLFLLLLFFRHSRIIDYTTLYKKLKEVDTLKDDFISMASHELRTPLTTIRGYVELLEEKEVLSDAQDVQLLERINISATRLDELVSDILDVSRIDQGRLSLEMAEVQVAGIVTEVCDSLEFKASQKGLLLKYEIHTDGAIIMADKRRLQQVLVNLVGNAVKYTDKGSVTVHVEKVAMKLVIRIVDTGIGMTEAERKGLFGKFYRVQSKEVHAQKGTGLGLWITKQLIESMKGSISVESIKGTGSQFIVSFPLVG